MTIAIFRCLECDHDRDRDDADVAPCRSCGVCGVCAPTSGGSGGSDLCERCDPKGADPMTDTTPTAETIRSLSQGAAEAGDLAMVEICSKALDGCPDALEEVADVLDDVRAQEDRCRCGVVLPWVDEDDVPFEFCSQECKDEAREPTQ